MNQRHIVALSLLWVGALVLLSRHWLGDVRDYVQKITGNVHPSTAGGGGQRL